MEKITPLLIGLAIFAFKTYQNYQKDKRATLQRKNAQHKPIPPYKMNQGPNTVKKQELSQPKPIYADKVKQVNTTILQKDAKNQPPIYVEEQQEMNEIQRFKKEREIRIESYKKQKTIEESKENKDITESFDLRKAVIMSTILDRPYQ